MYGIDGGTDLLNCACTFCFDSSILIDCKIEMGLLVIDWLFYQQHHFAKSCSQIRNETRNDFAMVEEFAWPRGLELFVSTMAAFLLFLFI